ncbi:MAG: hypothetical protein LBH48_04650 [Bifidobacteriaceae bacterium]|jgi:hypothetical protein|nr:hypothetical protein [Bifidobacteriaceae bacterium]
MTVTHAKPTTATVGRLVAALTASAVCAVGSLCAAPAAQAAGEPVPAAPSAAAKALGLQRPGVSGALVKGAKITAVPGSVPSGATVKYQWLRNGKAIKGASHKTYKIAAADASKKLSVRVQVKAPGKSAVTQKSLARAVSKAAKAVKAHKVSISGNAAVGATLKAKAGAWSPSGTKLSYQWTRDGWNIGGATKASYKVNAKDAGSKIGLVVVGKAKARGSAIAVASAKSVPGPTSPVQAPPAATPPANQTPPPPATDKPAPDPAPPTSDPSNDPKPPPPTEDPTPLPTDPEPVDPIEVPAIAMPDGAEFMVPESDAEFTRDALMAAIKVMIPIWKDTDGNPVPVIADDDMVSFALYSNESSVPYLESPEPYSVLTMRAKEVITYVYTPPIIPSATPSPSGSASVTPGTPTKPPAPEKSDWAFVPAAALPTASGTSEGSDAADEFNYLDAFKVLPRGEYTMKMTVTKPEINGAAEYVPLVVTWPLKWQRVTDVSPPPVPVKDFEGEAMSFQVPTLESTTDKLTAGDFDKISFEIPVWTDIFNQPVDLNLLDAIVSVTLSCIPKPENKTCGMTEEPWESDDTDRPATPTPSPLTSLRYEGGDPGLEINLFIGDEVDLKGSKLRPIRALIGRTPAPAVYPESATGDPGGNIYLGDLKTGEYVITVEFAKAGWEPLKASWTVHWTEFAGWCTGTEADAGKTPPCVLKPTDSAS